MGKQKVSVGVTSATGYGVTLAAVVAAVLDYIGGDHSQPTKTTLALGIVAGVAYVTTQLGRYAQAHAQIKAAPAVADVERQATQDARWHQAETRSYGLVTAELDEDDPERLTDDEAAEDPEMGDPLDAPPESFIADPRDKKGGADHPERW